MTPVELKSTIDVDYIDHMGSDQRIVEAMLVSTKGLDAQEASSESVTGRINFLVRKRHGTPLECGALTVRVHAPIKVWREWHRHRVASYNEESGRYRQLMPVFWLPPPERPMIEVDGFKPSAPEFRPPTPAEYEDMRRLLHDGYQEAYGRYERMLSMKLDKGLARDVLGVGLFSTCYVTLNPRSCLHFLELRTKKPEGEALRPSSPLWEINNAALQLEAIFARLWPITHAAWVKHGRMAP